MTTDEYVDETTQNADGTTDEGTNESDELLYDELKAEAEAIEAENKTLKAQQSEAEKISNAQRRLEKAKAKNEMLKNSQVKQNNQDELSADDVFTLRERGFAIDSDEAKALIELRQSPRYAGKSLAEIAETPAGKAELEAIKADREAASQIDENSDSEEFLTATKKEMVQNLRVNNEVPESPEALETLAEEVVNEMNL